MRDKDDRPYAKTVLAIGGGAIQPIELEDGSEVIPLSHTVTNDDDTQTTCSIMGITDFEELVNTTDYIQICCVLITAHTTTEAFQHQQTRT